MIKKVNVAAKVAPEFAWHTSEPESYVNSSDIFSDKDDHSDKEESDTNELLRELSSFICSDMNTYFNFIISFLNLQTLNLRKVHSKCMPD